jgi:predicted 2-oxoglutarate/Fe(II)-dependent dioxygenase YbiX
MSDKTALAPMYVQPELMTVDRCQRLVDRLEAAAAWAEYAVEQDPLGHGVRQLTFDLRDATFRGLHDSLLLTMADLNDRTWGFNLSGWRQPLRVAKYLPGYRHDWHTDYTDTDSSKLAFSMPLNAGYTGGELQILETEPIEQRVGHAVVFPAFHGHRVTEVTAGVRYVLLGWLTGPPFV